ncbi:MAG: DUF2158 domain-containing protein [Fluviicoccus sp.]|uniref:DUF2158 domain-containing protein n=1 Tax=Fluviicoccus sp. TaxID=2003552 RepID=UPI00271ABFDC|nr:DUF2158 domain-containing protein [Fluviicoccus sp.]MDO8329022.1 DUF2158 domain-containing protein [Fluviicoccus sp.]
MNFQAGDVVQLKSGGPLMTVTGVVGVDKRLDMAKAAVGLQDGDVAVEYFDASNKLVKGTFQATSLNKDDCEGA